MPRRRLGGVESLRVLEQPSLVRARLESYTLEGLGQRLVRRLPGQLHATAIESSNCQEDLDKRPLRLLSAARGHRKKVKLS